jgi:hypothetical protein
VKLNVGGYSRVVCAVCPQIGPKADDGDQAVARWNARPVPPSGAGERVAVEEAVPSPVDDAETRAFIAGWNATRSGTDFDMALHDWMLSSVRPSAEVPA